MVKSLAVFVLATSLAQSPSEWQKVVEAGKGEGKVVLYSALVGAPSTSRIAEAFEAKYGIPVETLEARASELLERVRTEQVSGRSLGDVSYNGSTPTERPMHDSLFLPPPPPPRGKGQPRAHPAPPGGSESLFFQATYGKLGREFHEKLAAQDPSFTRDPRGSQRRVARGEYPIFLPSSLAAMKELEGLPLKTVVPSEGAVYVLYQTAIFKNASHPNAARLFMDFLLRDEAQAIYAEDGYGPVVEASQKKTTRPALLGTSDLETMAEMARLAREIYK